MLIAEGRRQTRTATTATRITTVSAKGTGIRGSMSTRNPASGTAMFTIRSAFRRMVRSHTPRMKMASGIV